MAHPSGRWLRRRRPGHNVIVASEEHARLTVTRTDVGIAIAGDVDVGTWQELSGALQRLVRRPRADRIVLDLSGLSFIDAHGLRLIVDAAAALPRPRRLTLVHPPPGLLRLAQILELDRRPGLAFERDGDAA